MRVFVTGASGHIASAVIPELLNNGHQVVGLARSDAAAEKVGKLGAEVRRGDLGHLDGLRAAATEADGVIHLAFDHQLMRTGQIVEAAETDSRRMRHETEDFCDQRLASFEIVLDKVMRAVQVGRERLNPNLTDHRSAPDAVDKKAVDAFFDQDRS